jgi:hypothetical protein
MMMMVFVVAQSDPISGGAGWVGAGLLGCVLAWLLLVHLPAQEKSRREMVASHEAEMAEALKVQRADMLGAIAQQRTDFAASIERILRQHEIQMQHLAEAVNKDMQLTRQMIQELRDYRDRDRDRDRVRDQREADRDQRDRERDARG